MAFTLVYTADHFVFDILMGWAYAIAVYCAFNWWWTRRGSRSDGGAKGARSERSDREPASRAFGPARS
jgi:hypothetical protein